MKSYFIFCAICCFIAVFSLPIGYYYFLRIIVFLGSVLIIGNSLKHKIYVWAVIFIIILILFNPLFPFYLYRKSIWMPIDIIVGILFLYLAFLQGNKPTKAEQTTKFLPKKKGFTRDRIISVKNTTKNQNKLYGNY